MKKIVGTVWVDTSGQPYVKADGAATIALLPGQTFDIEVEVTLS